MTIAFFSTIHHMVSYILCAHNGEKTLSFCIESILAQKDTEIELIAVNDGSKDTSFKILKNYEKIDRRVKLINQPNLGLAAARNVGIQAASGDYIASAAQDDVYLPTKTKAQILFMQKNHLDFSFTNIQTIDEKGQKIDFRSMRDYNARLLPRPLTLLHIALYLPVCSPTLICKKHCYEILRWNPGLLVASDLNLTLKMFLYFTGGKLNSIQLLRRIRIEEHMVGFVPTYGIPFRKFERHSAVVAAIMKRYHLSPLLKVNFELTDYMHALLSLENGTNIAQSYASIASLYAKRGYMEASQRMMNLERFAEKINGSLHGLVKS